MCFSGYVSHVHRFRLLVFLALLGAAACEPRGNVTIDPSAGAVGDVVPLFVASSRQAMAGYEIFGRERSETLGFRAVQGRRAAGTRAGDGELSR